MSPRIIARRFTGDESKLQRRSQRIVSGLLDLGTTHIVGVPDNATRIIYELCQAEPSVAVVPVCREGEAWAIASGLWAGGRVPVVVIQNTGFFESGDGLRGTAIDMGVPLLALIDYRGHHTLNGGKDAVDSAARVFEPMLRAWDMPYHFLADDREASVLKEAQVEAQRIGRPVAVLMA